MRRTAAAFVVAVLAGLLLLVGAGPASAHAVLDQTTPQQGATVDTSPREVTLHFSESVGTNARSLQVLDSGGRRVDQGALRTDGGTVSVGLRADLPRGSYTVLWRVVSADSHPVGGAFAFGVGVPAGSASTAAPPGDLTVGVLHAVARTVAFAAVALLVGAVALTVLCWPAGAAVASLRRTVATAWAAAGAATMALFLLQGPYGSGLGLGSTLDPDILGTTLETRYGKLQLVRIVLLALLVPLLRSLPGQLRTGERPSAIDLLGVGAVLLVTFGLGGHASTSGLTWVAVPVDALHIAAACVWLGGLAVVAGWLLRADRRSEALVALPRWSRLAQGSVLALVVTGSWASWRQVGAWGAFGGTTFGRLLLAKIGLFLVMALLAVLSHRWLVAAVGRPVGLSLPGLRPGAAGGGDRVRLVVAAEATLGVAALVLTALLVNAVPARTAYTPAFDATLTATGLVAGQTITVVVDVPRTSTTGEVVHAYTYDSKGAVLPVDSIDGTLTRPGVAVPVDFGMTGVGHGTANDVSLPGRGRWTLTLQVRVDASTAYAATTSYVVR